jgi:hypothetical protein
MRIEYMQQIELSKFMLYYALIVQLFFCAYLFNDKLEWVMLIGSFYISILFAYGFISELYTRDEAPKFISESEMFKSIGGLFNTITANKFNIMSYLKYILVIPIILHLSSIKLITNDKGNKKLRKSKSKTRMLNNAKTFICLNTVLFGIVTIFGFAPDIEFIKHIMDNLEFVPSYATPLLLLVSIIEVTLAAIVYQSY